MYQLLDPDQKPEQIRYRFADHAPRGRRNLEFLPESDRTLLKMSAAGQKHRAIARSLGLSPGTISRRLAAIQSRLGSSEARVLLDPACPLPDDIRTLAIQHLVAGVSLRRLASEHRIPVAAVQIQMHFARGVVRASTRRTTSVALE